METEALLKGRDCSAPLGNLNRFSETFFFKEDRSQDVCTIEIAVDVVAVVAVAVGVVVAGDFSTLPWLSLRNGGGSHFLLWNKKKEKGEKQSSFLFIVRETTLSSSSSIQHSIVITSGCPLTR